MCLLTYSSFIIVHNVSCQETAPGTLAHKLRVFHVTSFYTKVVRRFFVLRLSASSAIFVEIKTERQNKISAV